MLFYAQWNSVSIIQLFFFFKAFHSVMFYGFLPYQITSMIINLLPIKHILVLLWLDDLPCIYVQHVQYMKLKMCMMKVVLTEMSYEINKPAIYVRKFVTFVQES